MGDKSDFEKETKAVKEWTLNAFTVVVRVLEVLILFGLAFTINEYAGKGKVTETEFFNFIVLDFSFTCHNIWRRLHCNCFIFESTEVVRSHKTPRICRERSNIAHKTLDTGV